MEKLLMLAAYFLTGVGVFVAGYILGRDVERTEQQKRNARRRAHRHKIEANRPRTTTRKDNY